MRRTVFLSFVLLFLLCGCKLSLEPPTVSRTDNFRVTKMAPDAIEAELTVGIKNPNSIGFNVYKSWFDVSYGGQYLGKAYLKKKVRIGANSDKSHTFYLKSDLKGVSLAEITKLVNGKSGQLEIIGNLKVGKWFYKKKFEVKHKQRVSLQ